MRGLFHSTCQLLRRHDPGFPIVPWPDSGITIRDEFLGDGYAKFTQAGARAAQLMRERAGLPVNGTYSAKALAAMLADAERGDLAGKVILFWNTYNSRDLSPLTADVDYRGSPRGFHRYFEKDVQALDNSDACDAETAAFTRAIRR